MLENIKELCYIFKRGGVFLKVQRYKRDSVLSYALGATLTFELLKNSPHIATRVLVKSSIDVTSAIEALFELCKQNKIPIETNDKAFNILSQKGNCFVIGEFKKSEEKIQSGNHIVLVNPSDAGNLGTILRTATGFGITNIAIIRPAVDFYDPKTIRASMGAAFHVNVEYFDNIHEYINRFPDNHLYSFMLTSSKPLSHIEINAPYSLIFGNEATGLPDDFASFSDSVVIPHSKDIDSLNLPIAASIAIYEFTKNSWR